MFSVKCWGWRRTCGVLGSYAILRYESSAYIAIKDAHVVFDLNVTAVSGILASLTSLCFKNKCPQWTFMNNVTVYADK